MHNNNTIVHTFQEMNVAPEYSTAELFLRLLRQGPKPICVPSMISIRISIKQNPPQNQVSKISPPKKKHPDLGPVEP